jgi:hypothetical protein
MARPAVPRGPAARAKMATVMGEFKRGRLHSGRRKGRKGGKGPIVKSRRQALAIGLNQARRFAS